MNRSDIARICHEANRSFCVALGDDSQHHWHNAPAWQQESAIKGVDFHAANPGALPAASHEAWLAVKAEQGWSYGPVKNEDLKQHPCFVPFDQLPREQQAKDSLFKAICEVLLPLVVPERIAFDIKPAAGNKALYYPVDGGPAITATIVRVWSDTCVNLAYLNDAGDDVSATSVLVVAPNAAVKPSGYYCTLLEPETPAADPEDTELPTGLFGQRPEPAVPAELVVGDAATAAMMPVPTEPAGGAAPSAPETPAPSLPADSNAAGLTPVASSGEAPGEPAASAAASPETNAAPASADGGVLSAEQQAAVDETSEVAASPAPAATDSYQPSEAAPAVDGA